MEATNHQKWPGRPSPSTLPARSRQGGRRTTTKARRLDEEISYLATETVTEDPMLPCWGSRLPIVSLLAASGAQNLHPQTLSGFDRRVIRTRAGCVDDSSSARACGEGPRNHQA